MEYRNSGQLEFRVRDKTAGIVEARTNQLEVVDDYVSVFADGFWDRVVARSNKLPKILVDHEGRRAGRVTETRQLRSADGLFQHCTMQYDLESRYGAEAFHDILSGSDDEFSHGFVTAKQHVDKRDGMNVTIKDECRMWPEVSQVLAGASPGTGPISVRSALEALGLRDLRAAASPAFDGAQCPYCTGPADAPENGCTCESDCGAAKCPMADESQQRSFAQTLLDYRAVAVKDDAPKSPPKGYPADNSKYGDPTNYKYPIDTDARIHAAIAYYNHDGQQAAGGYDDAEWASIGRRIVAAANKAFGDGYSLEGGKIKTPSTNANGRAATPLISVSSALALDTRVGAAISAANRKRLQASYDQLTQTLVDIGVLGSPSEEADEPPDQRSLAADASLQEFRATLNKMGVEL